MAKKVTDEQPRVRFDCAKCPAICCAVYPSVPVTPRDIRRLAKHFGVTPEEAIRRYTKMRDGERVLRRKSDPIFDNVCRFLDPVTRGCTVYHARPNVCREFPKGTRCGYYDLLQFERRFQDNPNVIPLVELVFYDKGETDPEDNEG